MAPLPESDCTPVDSPTDDGMKVGIAADSHPGPPRGPAQLMGASIRRLSVTITADQARWNGRGTGLSSNPGAVRLR